MVFSAYAEVVPLDSVSDAELLGILRVRGGSSRRMQNATHADLYSPRTRR